MSTTNYTISGTTDITGTINEFATASSFAVNINSPSLSSNVDFTLPPTAPTSSQMIQRTGATALGWVTPSAVQTGGCLPVLINYSSGNIPTTGSNAVGASSGIFIFSGTSVETPTAYLLVATTTTNSFTGSVRDYTNASNIICTVTVPSGVSTPTIFSTTTFTNLPASQAIFEFVVTSGNGTVYSSLMY